VIALELVEMSTTVMASKGRHLTGKAAGAGARLQHGLVAEQVLVQ
jgi:hypothetical protein